MGERVGNCNDPRCRISQSLLLVIEIDNTAGRGGSPPRMIGWSRGRKDFFPAPPILATGSPGEIDNIRRPLMKLCWANTNQSLRQGAHLTNSSFLHHRTYPSSLFLNRADELKRSFAGSLFRRNGYWGEFISCWTLGSLSIGNPYIDDYWILLPGSHTGLAVTGTPLYPLLGRVGSLFGFYPDSRGTPITD